MKGVREYPFFRFPAIVTLRRMAFILCGANSVYLCFTKQPSIYEDKPANPFDFHTVFLCLQYLMGYRIIRKRSFIHVVRQSYFWEEAVLGR